MISAVVAYVIVSPPPILIIIAVCCFGFPLSQSVPSLHLLDVAGKGG